MELEATCPYCGEPVYVEVDPGAGSSQRYVEDCSVCCQPWEVYVESDGEECSVVLTRQDD